MLDDRCSGEDRQLVVNKSDHPQQWRSVEPEVGDLEPGSLAAWVDVERLLLVDAE